MPTSPTPTASPSRFDSSPLSWVRGEIESSLTSAGAHLDALRAAPGDAKAVQSAALCVHQVSGALSMVGLGAAARMSEEIEKLVAAFVAADPAAAAVPAAVAAKRLDVAKNAILRLSTYLDGLIAGEADRPMTLAASYIALNRARGANDASAIDLFTPDLSATVSMPDETAAPLGAEQLAEAVRQARAQFQAGLLRLLRDKDLVNGARTMRDASLAIESLLFNAIARSFWFVAAGFFDAVANDPAGAGTPAVQLFGKIDQQIKLLMAGNTHVPEKLFRDLLLVIGKSSARTAFIDEIREVYRLGDLLAAPDADFSLKAEPALVAAIAAMGEQVRKQKENLLAFSSRNIAALEPFAKQAELLASMAQQMPNRELAQLLQVMGSIGRHLRKTGQLLSEVQALEVAGAMLFVESSLENYFRLDAEFAGQATAIALRLRGAMNGVELPALEPTAHSLGDTMTLRAQTHLLIFQVGREVQINLNTIEAALDGFFRDPQKIAELAPLPQLFSQVNGALKMLELDEAAALGKQVAQRVAAFATGKAPGTGDAAAAVAEGISALGIYVNGLQQNAADPRALLLPALIRFGLAEKTARPKRPAGKARTAPAPETPAVVPTPEPAAAKAAPAFAAAALPGVAPAVAPAAAAPAVVPAAAAPAVVPGAAAPQSAPMPAAPAAAAPASTHQELHLALDQALGQQAPAAVQKPAQAPAAAGPLADAPSENAELVRLRSLVIAQRAGIKQRDLRIQALELELAKLGANPQQASTG